MFRVCTRKSLQEVIKSCEPVYIHNIYYINTTTFEKVFEAYDYMRQFFCHIYKHFSNGLQGRHEATNKTIFQGPKAESLQRLMMWWCDYYWLLLSVHSYNLIKRQTRLHACIIISISLQRGSKTKRLSENLVKINQNHSTS